MKTNDYIFINYNENKDICIYNQINSEYMILLDYNEYINNIYNSYKSNSNIVKQFKNDFNRASYKINNKKETNIDIFIDYFEFLLYQKNSDFYQFLMLCTQAVMGTPLEILYKNLNNNIYIGEVNSSRLIFNICIKNDIIIIKKKLRFFYIKNNIDKTISYINIKIYIPFLKKEKVIITYKILKNK